MKKDPGRDPGAPVIVQQKDWRQLRCTPAARRSNPHRRLRHRCGGNRLSRLHALLLVDAVAVGRLAPGNPRRTPTLPYVAWLDRIEVAP